ncbi:MAG: YbjN domain-containing protein [Maricaulaceae bacterium]
MVSFRRRGLRLGVVLLTTALLASQASAQTPRTKPFPSAPRARTALFAPQTLDSLAQALREAGYPAQIERDETAAWVVARVSLTRFRVYLLGCDTPGRPCSAEFLAGYDLDAPLEPDVINLWNLDRRFAKVAVDGQGDPYLQMDVNFYGGVSWANFLDTLDWWRIAVEEFERVAGWR